MLNSKTPLLACVLATLLGVGATLGVQNHESVRKVSGQASKRARTNSDGGGGRVPTRRKIQCSPSRR